MTTIDELDKKISENAIESNELSNHKKILEQILFLERREKELMEYIVNVDKWGQKSYSLLTFYLPLLMLPLYQIIKLNQRFINFISPLSF